MTFGLRIKKYRTNLKLTQSALAEQLNISKSTLAMYETDKREPNVDMIKLMSNVFSVSANELLGIKSVNTMYSLTNSECLHIDNYRKLDVFGKKAVDTLIDIELERITPEPARIEKKYIELKLYDMPASAGTGVMLSDSEEYSTIQVEQTSVSLNADLCIRVSGDSMNPHYHDGDIVYVFKQPHINVGEVGIFVVNGEGFIKKLGDSELISTNKDYKNVKLADGDTVVCYGKVIGKV